MDSGFEGSHSSLAEPSSISTTLLERIRAHQPEAWQRLVELYGPVVFLWCRRSGLSIDHASDVAQEVWMAVARNIATFRRQQPEDSFRGWLWTITRNEIRNRFDDSEPGPVGGTNALQRLSQVPDQLTDSTQHAPSITDIVVRKALDLIRGEFEERTWQAFWRTTIEGRSAAEVGDELGMTKHTVRQAKYRVVRRLRDELKGLLD